jgi:thioredoxin-related protein
MKNIRIILIPIVLFFLIANLKSEEIKFVNLSWNAVVKQATEKNKYIFVDAYTDWCGWCKVMDKQTFTDKAIIDYINKNFIATRFEMETGFGKTLAMKYRVTGFPSYLFFNPQGKLIYQSVGFQKPEAFIKTLNESLDPKTQFNYKGVSEIIELSYPDFYKEAFNKNGSPDKKFADSATVEKYLLNESDLFSEVAWSVMYRFGYEASNRINEFFLKNIDKYKELYSESEVNERLFSIIYKQLEIAINKKSEDKLSEAIGMIDKYSTKNNEGNKFYYRTTFYEKTENWPKFIEIIDNEIAGGKLEPNRINEYSWIIFQKTDDKKIIEKALKWMKPVITKNPEYATLDTYAALLFKAGKYTEAKKFASKAVKMGKEKKENVEATEKLLEDINKKLK